jgi:hypothetical protein
MDRKDWTPEFSDENGDSVGNWTRGHLCYILAKNFSTFCLCPKTFCDAPFKNDKLIILLDEISRQPSIQAVEWILLDAFSQIYSEN